jgi:hypothetical protein
VIGGLVLVLCLGVGSSEAKVPRKVLGKVHFTTSRIKDQAPEVLGRLFEKKAAKIELKRAKDKHWTCTIVAFFRKKSVSGPITIWLYDKSDKASIRAKEPVDAKSIDRQPTSLFIYDLDISPDRGFNKNRSYLIHVGQIIGRRHKVYARGEVSLKP